MSSLSLGPLRGCGSADVCCEGATEEAGGVGNPGLVTDAMMLGNLYSSVVTIVYVMTMCCAFNCGVNVGSRHGGINAKACTVSKPRVAGVMLYHG
jgi:hypothetical protein